ncbi:MAG: hypothetical protein GSR86_02730 [Desulfurococcales archaeon]|nr:hypothetical protein [Desulfurococcales archaeon]
MYWPDLFPFIIAPIALLFYLVIIVIILVLVLRLTRGMEPVTVYTSERRIQGDPRSIISLLPRPLEERGMSFSVEDNRVIVRAILSYIEVYPITMPSPSIGFRISVEPAGLVLGILLLLLGALGLLIDVLLALAVYDKYNKIARIVDELRGAAMQGI